MKKTIKSALAILIIALMFNGCKKDSYQPSATKPVANIVTPATVDSMVLTPGGWLPKSHVFLVEKGFHLDTRNGHVLKIEDATGKIRADFGVKHSESPVLNRFNSLQ